MDTAVPAALTGGAGGEVAAAAAGDGGGGGGASGVIDGADAAAAPSGRHAEEPGPDEAATAQAPAAAAAAAPATEVDADALAAAAAAAAAGTASAVPLSTPSGSANPVLDPANPIADAARSFVDPDLDLDLSAPVLSLDLPVTGNLGAMEVLPSAEELRALLRKAVAVAGALAVRQPHVTNLDKLGRRIRSDLEFVQRCCPPAGKPEGAAAAANASDNVTGGDGGDGSGGGTAGGGGGGTAAAIKPLALTPGRVQGIINNLRGFQGELLAAQLAPGVVGVLRRFQARVVLPTEAATSSSRRRAADGHAPAGAHPAAAAAAGFAGGVKGSEDAAAAAVAAAPTVVAAAGAVGAVAAAVGQKRPHADTDTDDGVAGAAAAAAGASSSSIQRVCAPVTAGAAEPGGAFATTAGPGAKGRRGGGGAAAAASPAAASAAAAANVSVEVDVVAQEGHCWIEVKNQELFGLESVHWTGAARHVKGLRRQVEELLAVAAAPQHHRRWRPPRVVLFFPSGVHPDVQQQLEARGAHVAVGPDSLRHLPPPPPVPTSTNLDVTTMCGLVSEVSHGGAHDPDVELWAQRTVHWRDCLAAERASPLLTELAPWLAPDRELLAADLACRQFQVLMDMFAGPRERQRWQQLQARMTVVRVEQELKQPAAEAEAAEAAGAEAAELCPRCVALLLSTANGGGGGGDGGGNGGGGGIGGGGGGLGRDQVAVFGLGEGRRAVTLTANGNAVRGAARAGVVLEAVVHRPVWLTGR
ncbi:hypothetical protein PLESTM_000092400 [Pleodorina starrii]|nr:hypothetical protein PLESTM_000092400 [Pleodorina starrii]